MLLQLSIFRRINPHTNLQRPTGGTGRPGDKSNLCLLTVVEVLSTCLYDFITDAPTQRPRYHQFDGSLPAVPNWPNRLAQSSREGRAVGEALSKH